jgi:diguanylate cyclase (GGDEF)-like protein/PAS domain S-box-containing protein
LPITGRLKLGTRIALLTSLLIAVIAIAILFYLPRQLERAAAAALRESTHSLAEVASYGLGEAMSTGAAVETAPILRALRAHHDLVYIVLRGIDGRTLAATNEVLAERAGYLSIQMTPEAVSTGERQQRNHGGIGPGPRREPTGYAERVTLGGKSPTEPIYQVAAPIHRNGRKIADVYLGFSMHSVEEEAAAARRTAGLLGLTISTLGFAGAFALGSFLANPIRRIARTTERIAAGARGQRAAVEGDDEIGQLAASFNSMVQKWEDARGELESSNQRLEDRVELRTAQLRESEEKYRMLIERNLAGVYIARFDGTLESANLACARMFGFESVDDLLQHGRISYRNEIHREDFLDKLRRSGSVTNFEVQLLNHRGETVWVLENARAVPDRDLIEGILLDITDRKRTEIEIEHRAYHDSLTGLPNRNLLRDRLGIAVAHARRRNRCVAVLFLDVDDLKGINDTFGHQVGDRILQAVGDRLSEAIRAEDTVARIGGDEFAIVLSDLEDEESVRERAESIILLLQQKPVLIHDEEIRVTASVGAAVYPRDGEDPDRLLRNADSTMYRIKEKGGRGFRIHNQADSSRGLRRSSLETELREGLARGEFVLHYQPQYDLTTRRLVGAEALVRWNHPEGIVVPPQGFITLAEHTGLIIPLGEAVLRMAIEKLRSWQQAGATDFSLGVNISVRQFHQRDFIGLITDLIRNSGVDPSRLEFEITESLAVQKSGWTMRLLETLRGIGIRIAVDDFGTGRSSLIYLKSFPIDSIKIDQEFVRGVATDLHDQSIVTAILMLARKLQLRTIAEGVEYDAACEILRELGCRDGQGYFFSHPLPVEEFEKILFEDVQNDRSRAGSAPV